jgi:DNA (cytosine-5)-methyltransferase 1
MTLNYLSVCSGIEAATQAFHPLGWKPVAFSEIEPFPCAVLAHHYPGVPNWGDMTKFQEWPDAIVDVLCGGTPCQSFSVAGLRQGLADPRGNLMLTFGAIAARYRPKWVVWENVPGVLSSNGGRDFAAFLSLLGQLGYGWAYRVLDAQHVRTRRFPHAVPQRRRRVFVVGYLGDWRRAAAVLFDRESLSGHPAPRRKAGQGTARGIEFGPSGGGFADVNPTLDTRAKDGPIRNQLAGAVLCADIAPTLNAHFGEKQGVEDQHINGGGDCSLPPVSLCLNAGGMGRLDAESETFIPTIGGVFDVSHTLRGEGFNASEDGTGRGTPLVPVAMGFDLQQITSAANRTRVGPDLPASTLAKAGDMCVAIQERAICENPNAGPNGTGIRTDGAAYTLEARTVPQAVAFDCKGTEVQYAVDGSHPTLRSMGHSASHQNAGGHAAVAFEPFTIMERGREGGSTLESRQDGTANAILTPNGGRSGMGVGAIAAPWAVRRLTPRECERLQGFHDGFTDVPYRKKAGSPDGPRYKALGNSWAVNEADWIAERISEVDGWGGFAMKETKHG